MPGKILWGSELNIFPNLTVSLLLCCVAKAIKIISVMLPEAFSKLEQMYLTKHKMWATCFISYRGQNWSLFNVTANNCIWLSDHFRTHLIQGLNYLCAPSLINKSLVATDIAFCGLAEQPTQLKFIPRCDELSKPSSMFAQLPGFGVGESVNR